MVFRAGLMVVGLAALSGCGGSSGGGTPVAPVPEVPPALEANRFSTVSAQSRALILKYNNAAPTPALPTTGSATYRGTVGFHRTGYVEAGTRPEQIGDITLNTDFATQTFNGAVRGVVTTSDNPLTGQMDIVNGTMVGGLLVAPVQSTLGLAPGSAPQSGSMVGVMYGPNAEAVSGTINAPVGSGPSNGFFIAER